MTRLVSAILPKTLTSNSLADGRFDEQDFIYIASDDEYRCPEGHVLRSEWREYKDVRTHITKADTIIYRSRTSDCAT